LVGDMGEVHLWGRGEGAVVSTCMLGWGIGRGDTARAVHTSDIACAMPLTMKWRCDDMGHHTSDIACRSQCQRPLPNRVVMGARWVLMRLIYSSLLTAADSQQPIVAASASSVIIGCDDRRARRVPALIPALVLVLAHHLAQYLAP
jgi:hypothetical protein